MVPILIFTDNAQLNDILRQKSMYLADFNEVLNDYNALNLADLTGDEFRLLFYNPGGVVFDKMMNGAPFLLNGLPVNRDEAIKLVAKPAGFQSLVDIIESLKRSRTRWADALNDFDIVANEVVLKQSVIDGTTEAAKIYLTTDEEKKLYDFSQAVIAAGIAQFGDGKQDLMALVNRTILTIQRPGTTPIYGVIPKAFKHFGLPS